MFTVNKEPLQKKRTDPGLLLGRMSGFCTERGISMKIWQEMLRQGYDDMKELQEKLHIPDEEMKQLC